MSTIELPASIALILVATILTLCVMADRRQQATRAVARPATMATDTVASGPGGLRVESAFHA